jgi:purine-binding chemotaxis protein CheW
MTAPQAQDSSVEERGGEAAASATALRKQVVVRSADALFAFPGPQILEILNGDTRVHPLPGCPPEIEGVLHVHSAIWSVLRLDALLGVSAEPGTDKLTTLDGAILLGRADDMDSGLRVNCVLDVIDVPETEIAKPPETLEPVLQPAATGVFDYRGADALILNLGALFGRWRSGAA